MMADEQNQNPVSNQSPSVGAGSPPSPAPAPPKAAEEDIVKLTPAQYNAMLDALDELEDIKSKSIQQQSKSSVDQLADEGRQGVSQPRQERLDLSQMQPEELISFILETVNEKISQPLMVKIEEIRVKDEIRELMRDEKNKDFWDYKDQVYNIAVRNPNLSIEEAYRLAKTTKGPSLQGDGGESRKDTLRSLPSRRNVPISERPGFSGSAVANQEPATRLDAAQMAWDKMHKEGKV